MGNVSVLAIKEVVLERDNLSSLDFHFKVTMVI
jgi:hypothetical protein